jgi:hypothetical protein
VNIDRSVALFQIGLAAAALAVLLWGWWLGRAGGGSRWLRSRRALLVLLAVLSFVSHYNFFLLTNPNQHEFFHYYLGAKYSPELGYHGIYRCSVAAAFEQGFPERDPLFRVTDLRDNETRMFWAVQPRSPRCDGAFSPPRWEAFKTDVARFREMMGPEWRRVLADHGFNPSPIWTLVARPLTALVPVEPSSLWILARLDLALVLGLFAAIGWAFGLEAACLAAIAWGANPNHGYRWIGDAFLRNVWLFSAMLGLCLLRKQRPAGAGALLTLSSLLRIFPSLFGFGYVLRQLRLWLRERRLEAGFRRFAVSALLTGLTLGTLAAAVAGRGPGIYLEFSRRISLMIDFVPDNGFGLRHLLSYTSKKPEPEVVDGLRTMRMASVQKLRRERLAERRLLYWGAIAGFLALFWRASRTARDWEAAAMGAALIPVLTLPAAYYLSFALAAALLATRRPRIGIELMLALLGWNLAHWFHPHVARGFLISSAIGLAFFLVVLLEMQRTPSSAVTARA